MIFLKKVSQLWTYGLMISTLGLSANALAQSDIDYVDAVFAVSYNSNLSTNDAHLSIDNDHGNVKVNFAIEHTLLDTTQSAQFRNEQCSITPQSYTSTSKAAFRSKTTESLNFDWPAKTATRQHNKDDNMSFALDQQLYDPMSLFFKARCDLMAGKTQLSYPLIHKGKEKTHKYNVIGTEIVETEIGDFDTLVVQRQRSNPDRRTTFYVAPALDYLIVKINHRENSLANISMTLKSMDYKTK